MEQEHSEAIRRVLEGITGRVLEGLTGQHVEPTADVQRLIERMDARLLVAENTLQDVRLTLTGIGSLAKSLAERQPVHEDILQSLAVTMAKQDTINERLTASLEQLDRANERLEGILVGIRDGLARVNGRTEG